MQRSLGVYNLADDVKDFLREENRKLDKKLEVKENEVRTRQDNVTATRHEVEAKRQEVEAKRRELDAKRREVEAKRREAESARLQNISASTTSVLHNAFNQQITNNQPHNFQAHVLQAHQPAYYGSGSALQQQQQPRYYSSVPTPSFYVPPTYGQNRYTGNYAPHPPQQIIYVVEAPPAQCPNPCSIL